VNILGKEKDLWEEYLAWGFAFAAILSLIDSYRDGFASAVIVLIFFLITDIRENIRILVIFAKSHKLFALCILFSSLYFFFAKPVNLSYRLPVTLFMITFAGYRTVVCRKKISVNAIKRMGTIVVITMVLGLLWYIRGVHPVVPYFAAANSQYWVDLTRLPSVYVHPLIAAGIFMTTSLLLLGILRKPIYKITLVLLSSAAIICTSTRMAIIVYALCLILYMIVSGEYREIIPWLRKKYNKTLVLVFILLLIILLILIWVKRAGLINMLSTVAIRIRNIADGGNVYRWEAWVTVAKNFMKRPLPQILGGSGLNAGYLFLDTNEWMIARHGDWSGPVDNMFISFAYDYGIPAIICLIYIVVSSVRTFFTTRDRIRRAVALSLMAVLMQSITADFQYWPNIAFLMYALSGIHLGLKDGTAYREDVDSAISQEHIESNGRNE